MVPAPQKLVTETNPHLLLLHSLQNCLRVYVNTFFIFHDMKDVTRGIDTSLTLKLQKRLTELEQEKQSLRNELENKEEQFQRARARVWTLIHYNLSMNEKHSNI